MPWLHPQAPLIHSGTLNGFLWSGAAAQLRHFPCNPSCGSPFFFLHSLEDFKEEEERKKEKKMKATEENEDVVAIL